MTGEIRQRFLPISSSCLIRSNPESSVSRRGEDKPGGEERDTSITDHRGGGEGGERKREGSRGKEEGGEGLPR